MSGWVKIVMLGLVLVMTGCAGRQPVPESRLHHIVLCWLKEPGNLQQRQQIIEVSRSFREIPGVLAVHAGAVVPSDRGIVDDSFDVAIIVVVPDAARLAEYLVHPIHREARDDVLVPLVDRIVVYDFTD